MNSDKKTVLILSPQAWGTLRLSKHHYAEELVKKGYRVFFLSPHESGLEENFALHEEAIDLYIIRHRLNFPYKLRFHARPIFNFFIKRHVNSLLKFIGITPDILWCFDPNLYSNLSWFKAKTTIYHPVDPIIRQDQIKAAYTADFIFSVSNKILEPLQDVPVPKHFINHGLSRSFEESARSQVSTISNKTANPLKLGYVGNLLRQPIDQGLFKRIIENLPQVEFHFWGPYKAEGNNLNFEPDSKTSHFIAELEKADNVTLHGPKAPQVLAKEITKMDGFLLYYSLISGISDRSNSHKILEYLSTGKVIFSCPIEMYNKMPNLLEVCDDQQDFCEFVVEKVKEIEALNSPDRQMQRIDFALDNTYKRQLEKIFTLVGLA